MENIREMLKRLWRSEMNIKSVLEKFWLNDNEVRVYLSSLAVGSTTASVLAKKSWINRSTSQYVCQSLVNKRLMTSVQKSNSFIFSPESPEKLMYLLNREVASINQRKEETEKIIWDLKVFMNPVWNMPNIKYYQWPDWVIEILEDMLKENKDMYSILNISGDVNPKIRNYILTEYLNMRKNLTNKSYWLINDNAVTREYAKLGDITNRKVMLIPENNFIFKTYIEIYWNKVAFISFMKNDVKGFVVEDENVRETHFSLFKMWWELAKKYDINKENINITLL
jgi:sugar-specific transcriptional regulator TrmB